jgi:hypothetical protein
MCQRRSIFGSIIDAINHCHLVGGSSSGRSRMRCGCRDHLLNGPLAVEWHEKIAKSIPRSME